MTERNHVSPLVVYLGDDLIAPPPRQLTQEERETYRRLAEEKGKMIAFASTSDASQWSELVLKLESEGPPSSHEDSLNVRLYWTWLNVAKNMSATGHPYFQTEVQLRDEANSRFVTMPMADLIERLFYYNL